MPEVVSQPGEGMLNYRNQIRDYDEAMTKESAFKTWLKQDGGAQTDAAVQDAVE